MKILDPKTVNSYGYWNSFGHFVTNNIIGLLEAQAKLTHEEMKEKYSPFLDDDTEEVHPGIECVCEFKPISYGPVFVFESEKDTILLSETGTQYIPKNGSASTVYSPVNSLQRRISQCQYLGWKQIG